MLLFLMYILVSLIKKAACVANYEATVFASSTWHSCDWGEVVLTEPLRTSLQSYSQPNMKKRVKCNQVWLLDLSQYILARFDHYFPPPIHQPSRNPSLGFTFTLALPAHCANHYKWFSLEMVNASKFGWETRWRMDTADTLDSGTMT